MTDGIDEYGEAALPAEPGPNAARKRSKRRRRRVSKNAIEYWATRHLDRHASSAANLRRVLARRVQRIEREQEESFPDAGEWIDETIARMLERGYLDDRRYARAVAERMRARGASARLIQHQLAEKGVPQDIGREVVSNGDGSNDELAAAVRYARRRRLGPFRRDPDQRAERRERDLAALGRSGYSYAVARQVIEASDPEHLEWAANPAD